MRNAVLAAEVGSKHVHIFGVGRKKKKNGRREAKEQRRKTRCDDEWCDDRPNELCSFDTFVSSKWAHTCCIISGLLSI